MHACTCTAMQGRVQSASQFVSLGLWLSRRGLALKGKGDVHAAIQYLQEALEVYADQPRARKEVPFAVFTYVCMYDT